MRCICCDSPIPKACEVVRFETDEPIYTLDQVREMVHGEVIGIKRDGGYGFITRATVWRGDYKDDFFCRLSCVRHFAYNMARQMRADLEPGEGASLHLSTRA